ncbi:hypothetical protein CM49_01671 [Paenibacillus sp. P1XP2]|nr:hypothetical protein CM49_01671 [Paenibacillus sp. P1XP2]
MVQTIHPPKAADHDASNNEYMLEVKGCEKRTPKSRRSKTSLFR